MTRTKEELAEAYVKYGTLSKVAEHYEVCLESIRKQFIYYGLEYKKRKFHSVDDSFFSTDNELSYYWAGFLAADANVDKIRNRVTLRLAQKDLEHLKIFRNTIKSTHPINLQTQVDDRPGFITGTYYSCSVRVSSKQMKDDLARFNVVPEKSLTYEYPKLNPEFERHFIRGLIDGDGWVRNSTIGLCGTEKEVKAVFDHLQSKLNIARGWTKIRSNGLCIFGFNHMEDRKKIRSRY